MGLNKHFLPEVEMHELGHINTLSSHNSQRNLPIRIGKNTHQGDGEQRRKQPPSVLTTSPVHDRIHGLLNVLNLALHRILVFIIGFGLPVINLIQSHNVFGPSMHLRFGLITHQSNGRSCLANRIFNGLWDLLLTGHGVTRHQTGSQSQEQLQHGCSTMPRDPIISSRSV